MHAAALVHELRQPLCAIKALLQVLPPGPEADGTRAVRGLLLDQVRQMEAILEAAGDLSRPPCAAEEPFLLEQALRAAHRAVEPRAVRAGVRFDLALPRDLPVLRGDPVSVQQIVVNLAQNALDALEGVEGARIELSAARHGDEAVFEVLDNGPGIPEHQRERIFEPFFTTKAPGRGTGLGLAIACALVRQAGGRIELHTGSGCTRFAVHYPIRRGAG